MQDVDCGLTRKGTFALAMTKISRIEVIPNLLIDGAPRANLRRVLSSVII